VQRKKCDFRDPKKWNNELQKFKIDISNDKTEDGQLILDWLHDAGRYSKGARLALQMMVICKENGQPMLSDEAAACIRQILFSHKVKLSNFPAVLNSFAVLLLGHPLDVN